MVSKKELFVLGLVAMLIVSCFVFIVINEDEFINEEEDVSNGTIVVCVDCQPIYDFVVNGAWTTKLAFTRGDEYK